jgi:hypothetical protein
MSASVIDVTGIDVFFSLVNILAKWRWWCFSEC